ncbi:TIGR03086 family metal-binding protein [Kitasatospora nipponensis]|uniref:TIGR03086 family metal-binding protein n=1 Tax=Kitasatospora nipponensis TaxID=258049 RepID=A0ABP4H2Z8_9ACTN
MPARTAPGTSLARTLVRSHADALALAAPIVAAVRAEQLELPTPCAGWTLRRLLEHVVGQQYGFAAAARGSGARPEVWADHRFEQGPGAALAALAGFADSARELVVSFADAADQGRPFALPEISTEQDFPAERAIAFHLLDTLVHAWDVAAAVGVPLECPQPLAALLLRVAEQVPGGAQDRGPGRAFGPGLAGRPDQPPFDRALALLGRVPHWTPPRPVLGA